MVIKFQGKSDFNHVSNTSKNVTRISYENYETE